MKRFAFLIAIALALASIAGCAFTPPAPQPIPQPTPVAPSVPTVQPVILPTAPMPASVPTAIAKAAPILTGVNDVLTSGDISTAVDRGVTTAMKADPQHSTEIYLGGMAALTLLGIIGKVLDHRKVTTAIVTPGTTPTQPQ